MVLPDAPCLSQQGADLFSASVEDGGNLLVSGQTGLRDEQNRERPDFVLADLLGVSYAGENSDYSLPWDAGGQFPGWATLSGFLRPADPGHPIFAGLPQGDFRMPGQTFLQVEPRESAPPPLGRGAATRRPAW